VREDDYTFLIIPPSVFLRVRNISDKAVEKIRTRISFSIIFFFVKMVPFQSNVEKYCTAGQDTGGNAMRALCRAG
jgi:hypothetical protein